MIKTVKKLTKVEFAKNQIGIISIGVKNEHPVHTCFLQQIAPEHQTKNVGARVLPEEVKPLPCVELAFENAASVDILIKQLQKLKFNMLYPFGAYAEAC